MRIKIVENGPYLVTGNVPIREVIITPRGHHYEFQDGRPLPQAESYALCRCGGSQNPPFCDGSHQHNGFRGKETASRTPYLERITDVTNGETVDLLDDGRCAFARFCHSDRGDIWTLTENDNDPKTRRDAIHTANSCPAGRLTMVDKEGNSLDEPLTPEILIMQDPEKESSAGIFVKGPIVVEAADGTEYEVRNRVALCRCGRSSNKPFCDANHVRMGFDDGHMR